RRGCLAAGTRVAPALAAAPLAAFAAFLAFPRRVLAVPARRGRPRGGLGRRLDHRRLELVAQLVVGVGAPVLPVHVGARLVVAPELEQAALLGGLEQVAEGLEAEVGL